MAWEIEDEYTNLAEMHHRTVYVERSVKLPNGEPVRHVDDVLLGTHGFSSTRGRGSSNHVLSADGALKDADGSPVDIRARQQAMLLELNGLHAAARAWARANGKRIDARKRPR